MINTSPKLLFKLAAGCAFLYKKMASLTKSPVVVKKLHGTWPCFASLQMHFFEAEANFRMAQVLYEVCKRLRQYGSGAALGWAAAALSTLMPMYGLA